VRPSATKTNALVINSLLIALPFFLAVAIPGHHIPLWGIYPYNILQEGILSTLTLRVFPLVCLDALSPSPSFFLTEPVLCCGF
jgi:hypothetical protein